MAKANTDRVLSKLSAQAETLAQLSHQLGDAGSIDALLQTASRLMARVTSFQELHLVLRAPDGATRCWSLRVERSHPEPVTTLRHTSAAPNRAPDDVLLWLLTLRQSLLTSSNVELRAIPCGDPFHFIAAETESLISTTFDLSGRHRGVLALASPQAEQYDAVDRSMLRFFGTTLAGYLEPLLLARSTPSRSSGSLNVRPASDPGFGAVARQDVAFHALTRGVTHQFNNILCGLKMWSQLVQDAARDALKHPDLDPDARRTITDGLEAIAEGVSRGITVVDQLTDLTGDKRKTTRSNLFNPITVIDDTLAGLRTTFAHADLIHLTTHLDPDQAPVLIGDPWALRTALTNVLTNALEATAEGGHVLVHLDARGEHLHLRVTDTGAGIAAEAAEQILLPFYSTKGQEHTGLGLPVALAIVHRAGGELVVVPQAPHGTTVEITLPLAAPSPSRPVNTASALARELPSARLRALIIEHDPTTLQRVSRLLRDWGHAAWAAETGREAVLLADRIEQPDLVLVNQDLPDMSGASLVKILRATFPAARFVMLTEPREHTRPTARRAQADHVLRRPVSALDLRELLDAIRTSA